jgi:DNA repair protein RadC
VIHQSFSGASALKRVWPVGIGRALSTPKDAAAFMTTLQDEPAEVFAMICLTTKHRVIAYHEVLGDRSGRIRNRLRSVTRRVLIIGYEAR